MSRAISAALTDEERLDIFAVFEAVDRETDVKLPINLMADRIFTALARGERDPLRLKDAVLDRPEGTEAYFPLRLNA